MKNKKILIIFIGLFLLVLIGGYFAIKYVKSQKQETIVEEYVPEEEITDEQLRQTIVSLYFLDSQTNELVPEARLLDIKDMIANPYEKLVNLLIEGPKNEKNRKVIPENTQLLRNYLEGDCIVLDFSAEFLNYDKEVQNGKENLINSIVNTLTELTEINQVKILINGQENEEFNEVYTRRWFLEWRKNHYFNNLYNLKYLK